MLILHDLPAMHWALAGAAIGVITLLLKAASDRNLGISTSFENVCGWVSDLPYFRRPLLWGGGTWRVWFLGGLFLGGVASAVAGGGWRPFWDLGMWDAAVGGGPALKLGWMFVGGLLIGFGTRLAGGCTSGHGIYGMATFDLASVRSTLAFMLAGLVTTNLVYRVLF